MKQFCILAFLGLFSLSCNNEKKENPTDSQIETTMDKKWWKEAVIYQIYPRSFMDSDGDGIGDLKGIIDKLDYIESLGVDMVWLNPIYSSPNADNGYDISDYRNIMEEFGDMADFDTLLKGLHDRNIKFLMDVVVNHSSNEHNWFKESRSSRDNPYRNYYHWWPAEKGEPPYRYSLFDPKGDAWRYDAKTDAYYLHYFSYQQPDLNWENPKVRQEVYDIMKFWAEKGVDGFRLDAFQFVAKDTTYPKFPDGYEKNFIEYYGMQENIHDYLREMYDEVLSKYDVFAVSEGAGSTLEDAHSLVDADRNELQMAYHFEGVDIVKYEGYKLSDLKANFSKWDKSFEEEGWISIFLANHDNSRLVSRYGNDSPEFRAPSSKMLNTFILSMKGTPYVYYGDELGMTNIDMPTIEEYQDIAAINSYEKAKNSGEDMILFMKKLNFLSRDNARTPMQWDTSENAGFTAGNPWLPVNENYKTINVQTEANNPESCLNYFKKMVALRKDTEAFIYGKYQIIQEEHPTIYAYTRSLDDESYLVLLNFSDSNSEISLGSAFNLGEVMINNYGEIEMKDGRAILKPYQSVIYKLN
ncbi:glycoside hydrolase family 13 protein [Aegicerativicinus sediminis]|uniref:glycoside hydrolase family 13 protein n=1 Tax=Aegicerativicinus sediminis TaxID=2893202 RepID=UPI001E563EAD|nr:alpha-glucosidase [Aegicerativicinus sediminis]